MTSSLTDFLKTICDCNPNKIFWVISMWDALNKKERIEFHQEFIFKVKKIFPKFNENNLIKINVKSSLYASYKNINNPQLTNFLKKIVPFFQNTFKIKLECIYENINNLLVDLNNHVELNYNQVFYFIFLILFFIFLFYFLINFFFIFYFLIYLDFRRIK